MLARLTKWFITGLCTLLASCAIVTINVYFPEKDVKQAYKSLDEMLLKQGGEKTAPPEGTTPPPAGKEEETKPQSLLLQKKRFSFSFVSVALADDNVAFDLAVELSSMPDVLKAYDEMKARLPQMDSLRDSGAAGENRQGLVVVRDKAKLGGNQALIKAENDNRKTVITGMARAVLKFNKQPETKASLNQALGKAAAIYAETRRDAAKPGWWVELPNGNWVQK
ncbi:MAG: DUF1318 domain-containing protein [Geobacteraceae bacterium]